MAVTPANIAVALGVAAPEPGSVTEQQWAMWISDAEMLIEIRRAELDASAPDQAKVDYVVRESVVAQVKRPDDATQVTVSVDDGSTSRTFQSGSGRVGIREEWWTLLGLRNDTKDAFSIDMIGAASMHLAWCALNFGALYCSCGADIAGVPIYEGADEW
ncbi:hypothetical protein DEU34_2277 [Microbacterium sp. AG1240]|uniref:hypothetical protein n=1 Tax=Microbacterium sp. AG1240 TaxID=2183992 RepID=UPI000F2A46F2|nr:hypothetical protein [Microbacterium sp. AG1240]RKT33673.1 hypothetical protein DEU34_2277 [Microbacterium sp. AG1240]